MAGRSRGVVVYFLYWSLRRLLELAVLRCRSEQEKEIEILLLRHQLRVLERQVARQTPVSAQRLRDQGLTGVRQYTPDTWWRRLPALFATRQAVELRLPRF